MKIVCFGDSLTRGVSFVKGRLRILKANYPTILQELYKNNNHDGSETDVEVLNKGVFNDNSDLLLNRLDKDVMKENPEFVIIGIGGNDCNFQWEEVSKNPNDTFDPIVPLERYIQNVKSIIVHIKKEGITPILLTLPPLDPVRYYENISKTFTSHISNWICKVGGIEHWHGKYNRSVNKIAEELHVMKIDVRTAIKQAGELVDLISDDGIHLTEMGYKVLGTEIYRHMVALIEGNKSNVDKLVST
ncbi:SGNH/GDSL hydrolase family protein [Bacillus salitolerans]|uniref:SGNH/GDSL hydrolase family protein n=1 Tax=Bacillus salitolerans TaxID=1437434 RepID=A0ABW4LWV2_9BACI